MNDPNVTRHVVIVVGSLVALYGGTALAHALLPAVAPLISGAIGYGIGVVVHKFWSPAGTEYSER